MAELKQKVFLNVGSGKKDERFIPPWLTTPDWREVRLDIDADVEPDICCSATDMRAVVANDTFDAIWAANIVEHLYSHEVEMALREFARVVKPDGLVHVYVPNLQKLGEVLSAGKLEDVLYQSGSGPIAAIDILFGLRTEIAAGRTAMAHRTGFVPQSLRRAMIDAGLPNLGLFNAGWDILAVASRSPVTAEMLPSDLLKLATTSPANS